MLHLQDEDSGRWMRWGSPTAFLILPSVSSSFFLTPKADTVLRKPSKCAHFILSRNTNLTRSHCLPQLSDHTSYILLILFSHWPSYYFTNSTSTLLSLGLSACYSGIPRQLSGKESVCQVGDTGSIPGLKDLLEKEMTTYSSILAWEIPWTEEPGRL